MQKYHAEFEEAKARYEPTAYDRLVGKSIIAKINKPVTSYGFVGLVTFVGIGFFCGHARLAALLWVSQAVTCLLLLGLFNALGHMAKEMHEKAGRACNMPAILSPLFGGDYKHLDHHLNPGRYRNGWADLSGWIIHGLIKLGLATVPVRPPQPKTA